MTTYQISLMNPIGQHPFDRSIDRLFQDAVSASESQGAPWTPPCNVWEDEQGFGVQLALPGWEPQDVTLEVTNQVLSIKGERQAASAPARTTHVHEIADGRFMRMFETAELRGFATGVGDTKEWHIDRYLPEAGGSQEPTHSD